MLGVIAPILIGIWFARLAHVSGSKDWFVAAVAGVVLYFIASFIVAFLGAMLFGPVLISHDVSTFIYSIIYIMISMGITVFIGGSIISRFLGI